MIDIESLKYPIGRFSMPEKPDLETVISEITQFPELIEAATAKLSKAQLDSPYRPGGWSVRQVVHHLADSHMNAFIRFKLTLTEDTPTIKPYLEASWANLADSYLDIESSIILLKQIHFKWAVLLESMSAEDFDRCYFHPESQKKVPLSEATHLYAWHGLHHLAHIQHLALRENW
ncbi:YfiT family bacillithiol transferase [Algoriphagus formosus]|uniref:YfiT family bacillithiol transferase n=1 Tax=Algoriphagus formosus TaxID=2007308 RepID=UPI000C29121F|nr:putative metal-dependent hydrolase [Algoriphagus formosus]